jgi:hypothetical protein
MQVCFIESDGETVNMNIDEYKKCTDYVASIEFTINEDEMYITFLKSDGNGLGSMLIAYACSKGDDVSAITVEVDDCSDLYRQEHNIYTKLGFRYVESWGPEMIADVRVVIENYSSKLTN